MKTTIIFLFLLCHLFYSTSLAQSDYLEEHVIRSDFDNACSISGADIDGDGDIDFAATSFDGSYISWFENDGHQIFSEHKIIENFANARVLDLALIDEDNDFDIVATALADEKISWFENDGNGNYSERIVVENWTAAGFVMAYDHYNKQKVDFDNDGDTDILATSISPGNKVSWFENDGDLNFTEHVIKENWYWARYSCVVDIDQDGDQDIASTAKTGEILLFINNGFGEFDEKLVINNWGEVSSVQAADIDEDGDIDLAATSVTIGEVAWFENDGQESFAKHTIKTNYNGAFSVAIADIDMDSDIDIIAEAWIAGLISVFENDGSENFTEYLFCDHASDMIKIFVIDLDTDGDLDVLGACYRQDDLRWWENLYIHLHPKFTADYTTGHAPLTIGFLDQSTSNEEIVGWEWDFNNDGSIDSYDQNPVWIYENPGYYSVSLTTYTATGSNKMIKENFISVFNGESSLKYIDRYGYVEIPAIDSLNLTRNFTLELYINPMVINSTLLGSTLIDKEYLKIYIPGINLGSVKKNSVIIEYTDANDQVLRVYTPENTILLNTWQQIAISFDYSNNTISFYLNSNPISVTYSQEQTFGAPIKDNTQFALILGNNTEKLTAGQGLIDELRIWNYAKTAQQVLENLNLAPNSSDSRLISYYNMNEGNENILIDQTQWINNGSITGCTYGEGVDLSSISAVETKGEQPREFTLFQNYPNPFNPSTRIGFQLPKTSNVKLSVYNMLGQEVALLLNSVKYTGYHEVIFENENLSSGVYVYILDVDGFKMSKKMLLLK